MFRKCSSRGLQLDGSIFPHIFVWGSCFWFCIPSAASSSRSRRLLPSHTTCAHTQLAHLHTPLAHTQLVFTLLVTHNLSTHHLSSHHLSHHNLSTHNLSSHYLSTSHTTCHHATCLHTTCPSHNFDHFSSTHNLSSHNLSSDHFSSHHLSSHHLSSHNLSTHNLSSHNLSSDHLSSHHLLTHSLSSHNLSSLCVAGVARMALGWLWWRARFPRARVDAAAFCVAGLALGDFHLRFTWQAWYLVTSTFVSRGRRGTWRHGSSLCVAGVARMALGWLWWRARFPRA